MSTEELMLIPHQMFIQEQRQVSQVLKNPEIQSLAKQLSLLQRNSKRPEAPSTIHFGSKQQTENVTTADIENQSMANDISSKVLFDIDFLQDEKCQKAKKILETINESQLISIDDKGKLIFSNQETEFSASTFLYA